MSRPPLVSILMPVYNERAERLTQAVRSIARQTFTDFEFLILDDGSTRQETVSILGRLAGADPRIRWFQESHRGLTATLNAGIDRARGVFVCRQDSDDWSEPRRVERQVAFLQGNPSVGVVGTNVWTHQEDGSPLWQAQLPATPEQVQRAFPEGNPFYHGSTCYRTSLARKAGGYRELLDCAEDYDFFWRLCDTSSGANLPEALYHYRFVAGAVSSLRASQQAIAHHAAQLLARVRREGIQEDIEAALRQAEQSLRADANQVDACLRQADRLLLAGHYGSALRSYAVLVAVHPACRKTWLKLFRFAAFLMMPPSRGFLFSVAGLAPKLQTSSR